MRRMLLIGVLFAGCASASSGTGNGPIDADVGSTDAVDADIIVIDGAPDAPPDAYVPQTATLSQTTTSNVVSPNTILCRNQNYTVENSFYLVYPLATYGITREFRVQNVQFGVEESLGSHTVTVNVGTYAGTIAANTASLNPAQWTPIATTSVAVPNGTNLVVTAPIDLTIPAGGNLMVEVLSPSTSDWFFPGSNPNGETYPSFTKSPSCNGTIHSYVSDGRPGVHLVMSVTGTH